MRIDDLTIDKQSGNAGIHPIGFCVTSVNEGIDKETIIEGICGDKVAPLRIIHEGLRQQFRFSDGSILRMSDGGRFAVLKPAPEVPKFEEIEFVTFDGSTIFDTGIYGNEKFSLEIEYQRSENSKSIYLFGCSSTTTSRLTAYLTSSGYWRYGSGAPTFNCANTTRTKAIVTPGKTTVGSTTRSFSYSSFTTPFTVPIGGHKGSSGTPTPQFEGKIWYVKISVGGELVLDWIPMRRIADGVEGFWDNVSQTFIEKV